MYCPGDVESDRGLVLRSLNGEVDAWEEMYQTCNPSLLRLIKSRIAHGLDADQVQEIAQGVWLSLLENDRVALRLYDPGRGCRLVTYLLKLARKQARRLRRARMTRTDCERLVAHDDSSQSSVPLLLQDFLNTLSPREKQFCRHQLLAFDKDVDVRFSQANAWQIRHRIREKLREYVE